APVTTLGLLPLLPSFHPVSRSALPETYLVQVNSFVVPDSNSSWVARYHSGVVSRTVLLEVLRHARW
ncbi:hypothetical protein HDV05_001330, partial [Chytridiales sp. JEL 0842]